MAEKLILWLKSEEKYEKILRQVKERVVNFKIKEKIHGKSEEIEKKQVIFDNNIRAKGKSVES